MFKVGTKLLRNQTGQKYVIESINPMKSMKKFIKKSTWYNLKQINGDVDLIVREDELKKTFTPIKQTNADKIRSMSDEELENFMNKVVFCGGLVGREESSAECKGCKFPFCCSGRYIKWLKSEVEE